MMQVQPTRHPDSDHSDQVALKIFEIVVDQNPSKSQLVDMNVDDVKMMMKHSQMLADIWLQVRREYAPKRI